MSIAMLVSDPQDAAAQGAVAVTVGATRYTPGRAIFINCTAAGNATLVFADGSTLTIALAANTLYQFNWAIIGVSATTATATFTILT